MGAWSELPKALLQLISERLNDNALDLLRFRSVCSTWRSSIPKRKPHHLPVKFPLPFDDVLNDNNDASTFSPYKRTLFLITPHLQQSRRPWLIEIGQDKHGQTRLWHPLFRGIPLPFDSPHVLDFNQHRVLDLGHEFGLDDADYRPLDPTSPLKVVVATWQGNEDGFVLLSILVSRELALFRCGDEHWTVIPFKTTPYDDVFVFKGRPCAVDRTGRTVMVRPDSSVDLVAEPEPVIGGDQKYLVESEGELLLVNKRFGGDQEYLVEIEGELLLVDKHSEYVYEHVSSWDRVVRFDVYRLEEKEKRWVQLTTLGDRVLFLRDDCAFSASASDLCVGKGNCVMLGDYDGFGIRAFHLDDGRFSVLPDPVYDELFWPPPDWAPLHRQEGSVRRTDLYKDFVPSIQALINERA